MRVSGLQEQVAAGIRTTLARRHGPARAAPTRSARRDRRARHPPGRACSPRRSRPRSRTSASRSPTGTSSTTTTASTSSRCSTRASSRCSRRSRSTPPTRSPTSRTSRSTSRSSCATPTTGEQRFARVKVPPLLPRFVVMPDGERFVPLEQVIAAHLDGLFPGHGDHRAPPVPRHARRRLRARRRGRGPPRGDRERAHAAQAVGSRRAARGRHAR